MNARWPKIAGRVTSFRPQIKELQIERDCAIKRWRVLHPDDDVFEDRRLEITSSIEVSLKLEAITKLVLSASTN
jgi:hypothetical protein